MANTTLFSTRPVIPANAVADARNEAGGKAISLSPKHALAQYALTGCFNGTFYADAETQLSRVLELCEQIDDAFLAKLAIFARREGGMKDMPAFLCAVLSRRDPKLFSTAAAVVLDNARLVRTFVQIVRSGATGRRSLGTRPKKVVLEWFKRLSDDALFRQSVGAKPSIGDLVRMVHPKPETPARAALYAYLTDSADRYGEDTLPPLVRDFEAFKRAPETAPLPDVPFQLLTACPLTTRHWANIAERASWQTLRMNLNTFARKGIFNEEGGDANIARRLRDTNAVKRANVFPYQLLVALKNLDAAVPSAVRSALEEMLDVSVDNVPAIAGKVWVCLDVSASMHSPVSGHRKGATTSVSCVDVAALIAAAVVRKNPLAQVLPFHDDVLPAVKIPEDIEGKSGTAEKAENSIAKIAQFLAALPSGGTNCSAPLAKLNRDRTAGDLVFYVSDNESWVDSSAEGRSTATYREWALFKQRNPSAKLACLNLQPYETVQAPSGDPDILNIGGFSDHVFQTLADFVAGKQTADLLLEKIEAVVL
jgi:60 kDa SS-A/Ro ribonucleoprotein